MRDKFFIIDMGYVMNWLYNWTLIVDNFEEPSATGVSYELFAKFGQGFVELYDEIYFKQWQISVVGGQ